MNEIYPSLRYILVWPKADLMNRTQRKCQPWFSQELKRENLLRRSSTVVWRYLVFLSHSEASPEKDVKCSFAVAAEASCQAWLRSSLPCGPTSQVKLPFMEKFMFMFREGINKTFFNSYFNWSGFNWKGWPSSHGQLFENSFYKYVFIFEGYFTILEKFCSCLLLIYCARNINFQLSFSLCNNKIKKLSGIWDNFYAGKAMPPSV